MVSAYHLDGRALILTHYCIAKNQPTLKADRFDTTTGEIQFEFLRGTNMAERERRSHAPGALSTRRCESLHDVLGVLSGGEEDDDGAGDIH